MGLTTLSSWWETGEMVTSVPWLGIQSPLNPRWSEAVCQKENRHLQKRAQTCSQILEIRLWVSHWCKSWIFWVLVDQLDPGAGGVGRLVCAERPVSRAFSLSGLLLKLARRRTVQQRNVLLPKSKMSYQAFASFFMVDDKRPNSLSFILYSKIPQTK